MPRGRGKLKYEDLRLGHGKVATRDHMARVSGTIALHRGEILRRLNDEWLDLSRRDAVAGIRYGVEGMQVGGVRRITVPPQLGYGKAGAARAGIPADAVLICEFELLELRPVSTARSANPGKKSG
ncbi:MAG: hypothetical protein GIKADHBN_03274 [Phycisphaerales bacterium]|nr:hypothetical protein [Phycisphaerales bacterium]